MRIQFWARTDVGLKRSHNEDNFLVDKKLNLYVVCDGMGGHACGEVASATAVREVHEKISANRDIIDRYSAGDGSASAEDIRTLLVHAVQYACFKIFEIGQKDKDKRGMGTTLSLILLIGNEGFLAHVGDSRIYRLRNRDITQLTIDHSLLNELIQRGKIKSEEDIKFPFKNAVTRAVGVFETVEVDVYDVDVEQGDFFLLCSDGLHGYFENDATEMLPYMKVGKPEKWVDALVDEANALGGKDNITAVIVKILTPSESAEVLQSQKKIDALKAIPLFKYLTQKELAQVIKVTEERTFAAAETLFREGDDGECLYIILDGKVEISKASVVLAALGAGHHFGEMSLIDKAPRSAEAQVLEETRVLVFSRARFFELLRNDANLAVKLLWSFVRTLSSRLRSTSDELAMIRSVKSTDLEADITALQRATIETETPPTPPDDDDMVFVTPDSVEAAVEEVDAEEMHSETMDLVGAIASEVLQTETKTHPATHPLVQISIDASVPATQAERPAADTGVPAVENAPYVRESTVNPFGRTDELNIDSVLAASAEAKLRQPAQSALREIIEDNRASESMEIDISADSAGSSGPERDSGTDASEGSMGVELRRPSVAEPKVPPIPRRKAIHRDTVKMEIDPEMMKAIMAGKPIELAAASSDVTVERPAIDDSQLSTIDLGVQFRPTDTIRTWDTPTGAAADAESPPPSITDAQPSDPTTDSALDATDTIEVPVPYLNLEQPTPATVEESVAPKKRKRRKRAGSDTLPYIFVGDLEDHLKERKKE